MSLVKILKIFKKVTIFAKKVPQKHPRIFACYFSKRSLLTVALRYIMKFLDRNVDSSQTYWYSNNFPTNGLNWAETVLFCVWVEASPWLA